MSVLVPSPGVVVKLGSAIVHFEEWLSPDGHAVDLTALMSILADEEVQAWLVDMKKLGLLPVKR